MNGLYCLVSSDSAERKLVQARAIPLTICTCYEFIVRFCKMKNLLIYTSNVLVKDGGIMRSLINLIWYKYYKFRSLGSQQI